MITNAYSDEVGVRWAKPARSSGARSRPGKEKRSAWSVTKRLRGARAENYPALAGACVGPFW